ncbi:MAG: 23S rRNA (guanosine(2251)-2'-O)-methyltransferase RlmB [Mycoplasma sp.]
MKKMFGKKALLDQLKIDSNQISLVHLTTNARELIKQLKQQKVNCKIHHDNSFFNQFKNVNHQFVVTELKSNNKDSVDLKTFLTNNKKEKLLFLIVDSIQDSHNFGSILRTAEAHQVDGVIYKNSNQVLVNEVVVKTAMGAVNKLNLFKVANLTNTVQLLKEHNFWIYASVLNKKAKPINQEKFANRTALIVGNESEGISKILIDHSDINVFVPMYGTVQSLNVSVATGIMLYQIKLSQNDN